MGLFLDAAKTWQQLTETSYQITIGKSNQTQTLSLVFRPIDFDHLSGLQYANDVDFSLHRREYRGERLVPALLSGKLNDQTIEKSENWNKIQSRLLLIQDLEYILDSDFSIYAFQAKKLPFHSYIPAVYLIYSAHKQISMFLFIDKDDAVYYCKSIFSEENNDYRSNQTRWTILKKEKLVGGKVNTLYTHPNFKPSFH